MTDTIALTREEAERVRDLAEKIAKLGNGNHCGNSVGNELGRDILEILNKRLGE